MLSVNPIVTIREGFEKIASRSEVVVFGHPPGSALIQQGFSRNSNFVPVGNRRPSRIAPALTEEGKPNLTHNKGRRSGF
jgi:hypothetical protein